MTTQRHGAHGPNKLRTYLDIHYDVLNRYRDRGFVGHWRLELTPYPIDQIEMRGFAQCQGEILLSIEKTLEVIGEVDGQPLIQTVTYSYNASVESAGNILRYDNAHLWPGHDDEHHKHLFEWPSCEEQSDSPLWIGEERWPVMHQVVEELMDWYASHYAVLKNPEKYAATEGR